MSTTDHEPGQAATASDDASSDGPADQRADHGTGDPAAPHVGSRRQHIAGRLGLRDVPTVVWWITALHVVMLGAYSLLLPTYRAPDEPLHVDLAHLFSSELQYPAWDDRDTGSDIQRSLGLVEFGSRSAHLTADAAPPKDERPSLEDLEDPPIASGINQLPQHPPLYYVIAGGAERTVEIVTGDPDFQVETWFYRLVSIAFVAPLPLIVWRVGARLRVPAPVGIAAAIIPLAIPQYLHIGSSVNNDSLQLLTFWLITPFVLRLAKGELTPRTAALAGLITGVGLLTKAFAFIMGMWVLAALGLALWRLGRSRFAEVARAAAIYGGVSFIVGGWWWARNLIAYGQLMPSRFGQILPTVTGEPRDVTDFVHAWGSATTRRFWGDFGWYDVHMSGVVVAVASVICLLTLAVSCVGRDRVASTLPSDRLLLAAPFLFLVIGQFAVALRGYLDTGRMGGLQGRYWFGALAAIAVLVALGAANLVRPQLRRLPLGALVAAGVMQGVAVSSILGFYWGAPGSAFADRFRAIVAWAPLPGELIAVGVVAGVLVAGATIAQLTTLAVRAEGPGPATPLQDA